MADRAAQNRTELARLEAVYGADALVLSRVMLELDPAFEMDWDKVERMARWLNELVPTDG